MWSTAGACLRRGARLSLRPEPGEKMCRLFRCRSARGATTWRAWRGWLRAARPLPAHRAAAARGAQRVPAARRLPQLHPAIARLGSVVQWGAWAC